MNGDVLSDAVILAGGFGTRLQNEVKGVPKPMAPVNNKPFLEYLFNYLNHHQLKKLILSVGYKAEIIQDYFKNQFKGIEISYAVENEPLGTGGAICNALQQSLAEDVLVLNGDTFFDINLSGLFRFHKKHNADVTICLRSVDDVSRYGSVTISNKEGRITDFLEKGRPGKGFINGGIYLFKKELFIKAALPEKFSIEKDFFEQYYKVFNMYGFVSNAYFIDIGIPEEYKRAQNEVKRIEY